ncbi:MAG TPA: hypothetical protein VHL11_07590, partial [Phototrophicaceae bacterium]|nr:hypothetical protein [Phototrophicaceae bacterium]
MAMKCESVFTAPSTPSVSVTSAAQIFTPELLITKLTPPPAHRSTLARHHLFDRLNQGLTGKLTVLAAPAGSGKTTLVSTWLTTFPPGTTAWLTLEKGDNDPVRFWRYVITACQKFDPMLGSAALAQLRSAQSPPFEA